ncbi:MAG: VWA domain-containing protein [Terriglobales bacterium]|jgi:VWFA-related protein
MLRDLPLRIASASALILSLTASLTHLGAQQAPDDLPTITIRANTRLVVVDVVATDRKGQPVTKLKPEDFTLEENGKKQKVSVFVPPGVAGNKSSSLAPVRPGVLSNHSENVISAGIPTVLLLDAANSDFKDQSYARSQMLKYVLEQGQAERAMAVLTLTDRLRVLQQFTSDPQALVTAIKNLTLQEQILQPAAARPEAHALPDSPAMAALIIANDMAAAQTFLAAQIGYATERRTLITIEAMKALARILGGLPGRKNVVWLTSSLPFDLVPQDRDVSDAELLAELPGQGKQRSVGVNAAGSQAAEQRELHGQEIREAESQLAGAGVAIYPVDLNGLVSGMESSADSAGSVYSDKALSNRASAQISGLQSSHGTMEEVAKQTGGRAYFNQNEIKDGIALAASDERGSYTLGYYSDNKKWDGKFRNIKVRVSQDDTQLRYRKGYFAIEPGPAKNHNYEQDVAAALAVDVPATQVSFQAQAKPIDPCKIRVVFLVDAHTLTAEDSGGKMKMNVNLYATVWGVGDKNLASQSIKVDKSFDTATYQQILDHGMMVPIDMEVPAGSKELRLAVLDNKTGFIGTLSGPLGQ